jgi:hypothetical protein
MGTSVYWEIGSYTSKLVNMLIIAVKFHGKVYEKCEECIGTWSQSYDF